MHVIARVVLRAPVKEPPPAELPETLDETQAMAERMAVGGDAEFDAVDTMCWYLLSGAPKSFSTFYDAPSGRVLHKSQVLCPAQLTPSLRC